MKKLITIFLSALILLSMLVLTGCEKSSETEYAVIGIEVISPNAEDGPDSLTVGDSILVVSRLTGFTFEYSKVNYYFNGSSTPAGVFTKEMINQLAAEQDKDAEFEFSVSTNGLSEGDVLLTVEAVGNNMVTATVEIPLTAVLPTGNNSSLDFVFISPVTGTEFKIGDRIAVEISVVGNLTLYDNMTAFLSNSTEPIYESDIVNAVKTFDIETEGFAAGTYTLKVDLQLKNEEVKTKLINFNLVEFIPTFTALGTADGYQLKSLIQTYDNGYLAVMSYSPTPTTGGSRVIKYDKLGAVVWTQNIPASVGFAESVCEDTDYDKGYVLAGWRWSGTDEDTWVRKINTDDGSLIWNKTYDYDPFVDLIRSINGSVFVVNDRALVIKKTIDDGYIVGGYSENPYGTGELLLPMIIEDDTLEVSYTWETGKDIRLLKLYSNGNEVWGDEMGYNTQKMWQDITLHKVQDYLWIKKMGDQVITDIAVKDDGNYYVTGWNNWRLYFEDGTEKKDMFFAEVDWFGGFVGSMTWSRMGGYDEENMASDTDPYSGILNIEIVSANYLGDYTEDEIGYGIVESQGSYGGQVAMAGMTHQTDSKAKLNDGWVNEFGINMDEDGALWEYSFGNVSKNDEAYGIDRTRDGGYIVTGYSTNTDMDTWMFKLDSKLSLLWEKNLGVAGNDFGAKVLQCTDGGFMIGGNVGTGATARSKLIKVNKTGDSAK